MSQRSVCTQFTPQLWRATKCKFCFNDKTSHETASKENSTNVNIPTSPPPTLSPKPKRISTPLSKSDEILQSPTRRNVTSSDDSARSPPIQPPDNDDVFQKRPSRIKLPPPEDKLNAQRVSITSPIENISLRLEMNKQLLAKDDRIHNLEIRNQNLENEIRTLKDQNTQLARTQQSEEEHKKLLDKVTSLRRKLSDMEVKHAKMKDEKEDLEERLKGEEQQVSKLKIKINSMEHEHYLLELRVEREQKHKQSMVQEKEEAELELESLRKAYRGMQRESRKFSTTFDVDEERTRELEENLRQTQRRLGMVEVENNRLKDKINKVENERQDNHISALQRQLSTVQDTYVESVTEIEDLRTSHLSEIQSLQSQISRLQVENDELTEGLTRRELELSQMLRTLADADTTRSDMLSKDEELQSLRAEVVRLQDKCSALCDVELIHINLNKELDRHRERADRAEHQSRQLEREIEEERASREECEVQLEQLRIKDEECRLKHTNSHPPVRNRSLSLEPTLLSSVPIGILKKREPAERDNNTPLPTQGTTITTRDTTISTRQTGLTRKFQSLQNLVPTQLKRDKPSPHTYPARSVGDLKTLFELGELHARMAKTERSVSFDASVQHHRYDSVKRAPPRRVSNTLMSMLNAARGRKHDQESDSSYSFSETLDSSIAESSSAELSIAESSAETEDLSCIVYESDDNQAGFALSNLDDVPQRETQKYHLRRTT